jgi:hypothetical protein
MLGLLEFFSMSLDASSNFVENFVDVEFLDHFGGKGELRIWEGSVYCLASGRDVLPTSLTSD